MADTFDALTSDRPYRKGMSVEKAVAILREGSGSQWNSAVVEALIAILADSPELIPLYRQPDDPVQDDVSSAVCVTRDPDIDRTSSTLPNGLPGWRTANTRRLSNFPDAFRSGLFMILPINSNSFRLRA